MSKHESSSFLGTESQSSRVAVAIERDILDGILAPEAPLKSLRDLAADFHVSQMVIFSAMNILERKGLIHRVPRKGIFVRPRTLSDGVKNVLLFAMERNPGQSIYVRSIMKLISSPWTKGKINFTIRLVGSNSESAVGNLDYELQKLEQEHGIDMGVILPMGFLRRDVERALHLPFPVVFVGEFIDGIDYGDLNYVRIAPQSENMYSCLLEYVARCKYKRIVHLMPQYMASSYFETCYELFAKLAQSKGVELSSLKLPGVTEQETAELVNATLRLHRRELETADLVVSGYAGAMEPGFPLRNLCYLASVPELPVKQLRLSYEAVFEKICDIIFHWEEHCHRREVYKVQVEAELGWFQLA